MLPLPRCVRGDPGRPALPPTGDPAVQDTRIPDAIHIEPNKGWAIPEGSEIKGGGIRVGYGSHGTNTGLSVREYAELHGVSNQRIYFLLKRGRIDGATKGDKGWDIPESAPYPAEF